MAQLKLTKRVQTGRLKISFCKTIQEVSGNCTVLTISFVEEGSISGHPTWNEYHKICCIYANLKYCLFSSFSVQ